MCNEAYIVRVARPFEYSSLVRECMPEGGPMPVGILDRVYSTLSWDETPTMPPCHPTPLPHKSTLTLLLGWSLLWTVRDWGCHLMAMAFTKSIHCHT